MPENDQRGPNIEHIVVYQEPDGSRHSGMPNVIRLQGGDLLLQFIQRPVHEDMGHYHWDPGSGVYVIKSHDDGATWDHDSKVTVGLADGSSNAVHMLMASQLSSGELIANTHFTRVNPSEELLAELGDRKQHHPRKPWGYFMADTVYIFRSQDNGATWGERQPVDLGTCSYHSHTGKSGVIELPDGTLLLALHGQGEADRATRAYVMRSGDGGRTWGRPSTVAHDPDGEIFFSEPAMVRLDGGRLLTMIRTEDYMYQAHSDDDGWTWQGVQRTPIWGYPAHLMQLRSGRVLCAYGYRREPYGIRAVISEDDGQTWDMDHVFVIRDDGLHRDLGYPSSVQLNDGRILTTYYFHFAGGLRYIAGSIYSEDEVLRS